MSSCAVGLVLAITLISGRAQASAAAASCDQQRGRDLAPARSVRLLERRVGAHDLELVACARPRGRVRVIASRLSGSIYSERFQLRQVAGAFAALTTSFDDQYASGETTSIVNLRTGRSRVVASHQQDAGDTPTSVLHVTKLLVTSGGRAAASILDLTSQQLQIVAFGTRGPATTLDTQLPR